MRSVIIKRKNVLKNDEVCSKYLITVDDNTTFYRCLF